MTEVSTDQPRQEVSEPRRTALGAPVPRAVRDLGERHTAEVLFDALVLVLAMLATAASAEVSGIRPPPIGWAIAFTLVALLALGLSGAYRTRFSIQFLEDLRAIVAATAIAAMSITFIRVVATKDPQIAGQEVRAWLFAATYLTAGRAGFRLIQSRRRRHGAASDPTLIVGAGQVGHLVARRLAERPEYGLRPVAFFDDAPLQVDGAAPIPVVGAGDGRSPDATARIEQAVRDFGVTHVIVTFSLATHEIELQVVRRCLDLGVSVSLVPRLFEGVPDQTRLERLGGLPLISVNPSDPRGWQFELKYALDRVAAAVAIVLLSPLFALAALGTLITLGRPLLFRQHRIGIDGKEFDILKFRTMRPATDSPDATLREDLERGLAPGGVEGGDRRTAFGALLRRTSIDELPQLFNVLRGDMSLIGPRPERPEYVQRFDTEITRYADRLRVKSGITGWAQIHGLRGRTSIADRVEWDNYYIENWSPWLDVKILVRTALAVFRGAE